VRICCGTVGILIVDDSEDSRALLRAALHEGGLDEVWAVDSASAAFRYLGVDGAPCAGTVDLVFMDIMMPEIDGLTAIRRLRRAERLRDVPIIVITSHEAEYVLEEAFEAGAVDFVRKPFRVGEILARARAALRTKGELDRRSKRERALRSTTQRLVKVSKGLENEVRTDPVTGVINRRAFNATYRDAWQRAARTSADLSVLMVDVDCFHEYNERHGHLAGDVCLQRIAGALSACAGRAADCVARYGGDEFIVLLPDTPREGAATVAESMRADVQSLPLGVTVSLGAASVVPRPDLSPESLIASADDALYTAKARGRNRVEVADPANGTPRQKQ
jgi:diguanylate cyclase (GGDEF)-like protein